MHQSLLFLLAFALSFFSPHARASEEPKPTTEEKSQPEISPLPPSKSPYVFPPEELIPVPDEKERGSFMKELITTIATLGLIISLIMIFGWILKRMVNQKMVQANEGSEIKVVERRMISQKTAICAIEVGDAKIILAETATGVTHLMNIPLNGRENGEGNPPAKRTPSPFDRLIDMKK